MRHPMHESVAPFAAMHVCAFPRCLPNNTQSPMNPAMPKASRYSFLSMGRCML